MLKLIYNRIIDYCYYLYNINSLSDEIYTSGLGGDTASLNIKIKRLYTCMAISADFCADVLVVVNTTTACLVCNSFIELESYFTQINW